MDDGIKLGTPLDISHDDIERALLEYAKDEPTFSDAHGPLRNAAQQAAAELNRVLDVDVLEMLRRGWATVPSVSRAIQLSAVKKAPPVIIRLDEHCVSSTSQLVLGIDVAQKPLPELRLALELKADVQSATLAVREGRIELVALADASVVARLKYKNVLLKEHASGVNGAPRDPFRNQPAASERRTSVDFYI
ncbi:MAG: hypothetical protein H0V16_06015 [Burkholderiaceae bacterium]|nr:hypothetical protein [Burkholderiaceae bacterium]